MSREPQRVFRFDGETFEPALDGRRLTSQLERVYRAMSDGRWHLLGEIAALVKGSEAGVSARIRDLRKPRLGGLIVERKRVMGGVWAYRLVPTNTNGAAHEDC